MLLGTPSVYLPPGTNVRYSDQHYPSAEGSSRYPHIEAEAVNHDVAATVATFRRARYEVPAMGAIVDGPEAVSGLVGGLMSAFPDFYLHKIALHHADDAVVVEARFGGTHRGVWAGIEATGKKMEVKAVLIFVFEGEDLICEKVYFNHATVLRQFGVIA
jgi:predicted ester cyclase